MNKIFSRGFPQIAKLLRPNNMEEEIRSSYIKLSSYVHGSKGDEWEKGFAKYLSEIQYPAVKDFKKGMKSQIDFSIAFFSKKKLNIYVFNGLFAL